MFLANFQNKVNVAVLSCASKYGGFVGGEKTAPVVGLRKRVPALVHGCFRAGSNLLESKRNPVAGDRNCDGHVLQYIIGLIAKCEATISGKFPDELKFCNSFLQYKNTLICGCATYFSEIGVRIETIEVIVRM